MSKKYTWDKYLSNTDQTPIEDESENSPDSKDKILCDSPTDEIQEILGKVSPDQAGHTWHLVGVYVFQQIGGGASHRNLTTHLGTVRTFQRRRHMSPVRIRYT